MGHWATMMLARFVGFVQIIYSSFPNLNYTAHCAFSGKMFVQ
jgi:hypothetical protein